MTLGLAINANHIHAAQSIYRVVDVTELGFTPDVSETGEGSLGINGKGQVVYGRMVSGTIRAFVWLPEADYGLAAGLHDLSTLSGSSNPSIARDISESGIAVGQAGAVLHYNGEATAWTLGSTTTATGLGNLGSAEPWSSAYAVNDASPPIIVGDTGITANCVCGGSANGMVVRGFKIALSSPLPAMTDHAPNAGDTASFARDVNTLSGGTIRLAFALLPRRLRRA